MAGGASILLRLQRDSCGDARQAPNPARRADQKDCVFIVSFLLPKLLTSFLTVPRTLWSDAKLPEETVQRLKSEFFFCVERNRAALRSGSGSGGYSTFDLLMPAISLNAGNRGKPDQSFFSNSYIFRESS